MISPQASRKIAGPGRWISSSPDFTATDRRMGSAGED